MFRKCGRRGGLRKKERKRVSEKEVRGRLDKGGGEKESKVSLSARFNSIIIMGRHPLWDLEPNTHTHSLIVNLKTCSHRCYKSQSHSLVMARNVQVFSH